VRVLLSLGSELISRNFGSDDASGWFAAPMRWTEARMDIADFYPGWVQKLGLRTARLMCLLVLSAAVVGSTIEIVGRFAKKLTN
jgi:hypothetical protein